MHESPQQQTAQLLLEDGTLFEGKPLGKTGTTSGEICFNTGMTGYQEIMTDPSSFGQILVFSNCYVGNYGMRDEDAVSDGIKIQGLVCKDLSDDYSRQMADTSFHEALIKDGIVGIFGIDTRALVSHIRDKGAMNCIITSEGLSKEELVKKLSDTPSLGGRELASGVSTQKEYEVGEIEADFKVAVLDLGVKRNELDRLVERGALVKVFPARSSFAEMESFNPDGYFISDGPGDPAATDYAVDAVCEIQESGKTIFATGLGGLVLALGNKVGTQKMHHGHRGFNHPVLNKVTNSSGITAQNRGFGINSEEAKKCRDMEITHTNLNDDTIEGFRLKSRKAFAVLFNPDTEDSRYLFDDFIGLIEENKKQLV